MKYGRDKAPLLEKLQRRAQGVGNDTARCLEAMLDLPEGTINTKEGGSGKMCLAMRQFRRECILEGKKKGREEGRREGKREGKREGILEGERKGKRVLLQELICAARKEKLPDNVIQFLLSRAGGRNAVLQEAPA